MKQIEKLNIQNKANPIVTSHTGIKAQMGVESKKKNCTQKRTMCKAILPRFFGEGYNSQRLPEPVGERGKKILGVYRRFTNAVNKSCKSNLIGEAVKDKGITSLDPICEG